MKFFRVTLTALLLLAWAAGSALAMSPPVFSDDDGAIRGYDPVAYFSEGAPTQGSPDFTHEWMGAEWRFVSAENRDLFAADPEAYAPQYGGYCAWAASRGYLASIDPDAWDIHDGKLYLNYSRLLHLRWALDKSGNIAKGDANWPGILE